MYVRISTLQPGMVRRLSSTSRASAANELFRFYNKDFDKMPGILDSTENSRSFEKYPP